MLVLEAETRTDHAVCVACGVVCHALQREHLGPHASGTFLYAGVPDVYGNLGQDFSVCSRL